MGSQPPKGKGETAQYEMKKVFGDQAPPPTSEEKKELYVKIPAKYSDATKSGLTVTLKAGNQKKDIDLVD